MNKNQLVEQVAARTKSNPADVARIVNSVLDVVSSSVAKGDKVVLSGFGTFHRHARGRRVVSVGCAVVDDHVSSLRTS